MSEKDEMEKYVKDSRIPCKYGNKCYQKNSAHHEKYKHPIIKRKVHSKFLNTIFTYYYYLFYGLLELAC